MAFFVRARTDGVASKGLFWCGLAFAATVIAAGFSGLEIREATAGTEARTLSLYNVHNKESLTITYKSGGAFDTKALEKINWFMRDWRTDDRIEIDPVVIDTIWEMHRRLGSNKPVHLISGYRSPKTNAKLRRQGRNVAKTSRHMHGQAADVFFPDVSTKKLRELALVMQRGGVGYYPRSGKYGFVHIDTGRVRHWPRMAPDAYAALLKKKGTMLAALPSEPARPTQVATARPAQVATGKPLQIASLGNGSPNTARNLPRPIPKPASIAQLDAVGTANAAADNVALDDAATVTVASIDTQSDFPAADGELNIAELIRREIERDKPRPQVIPATISKRRTVANVVTALAEPKRGDEITGALAPSRLAATGGAGLDSGTPHTTNRKGNRLAFAQLQAPVAAATYQQPHRRLIVNRELKGNLQMTREPRYAEASAGDDKQ